MGYLGVQNACGKRNRRGGFSQCSPILCRVWLDLRPGPAYLTCRTSAAGRVRPEVRQRQAAPESPAVGGFAAAAPTTTTAAASAGAPAASTDSSADVSTGQPYQQYQSDLTAGQVDDNAKFSDYLDYLHNYNGDGVMPVDVSQRLFVRVLDSSQQPVAGAGCSCSTATGRCSTAAR